MQIPMQGMSPVFAVGLTPMSFSMGPVMTGPLCLAPQQLEQLQQQLAACQQQQQRCLSPHQAPHLQQVAQQSQKYQPPHPGQQQPRPPHLSEHQHLQQRQQQQEKPPRRQRGRASPGSTGACSPAHSAEHSPAPLPPLERPARARLPSGALELWDEHASSPGSASPQPHQPQALGSVSPSSASKSGRPSPKQSPSPTNGTHSQQQGKGSQQQRRVLPKEYRHGHVPKYVDLEQEYKQSPDVAPTTLMIRNIPNHYTQRQLIAELDDLGFAGTFDFLYIPLDKGTMSNVGYAFVNFVEPSNAEKCMASFQGYRFRRHRKIAAVSVAHIQGLEANLQHYEHAAVNTAKLKQRRPVIMANISSSLTSVLADFDDGEPHPLMSEALLAALDDDDGEGEEKWGAPEEAYEIPTASSP